jgi:hypothetical protein
MSRPRGDQGSIILFVLFVCLGVAVLVQTLSVVVLCAEHGREVESTGRQSMAAKDAGLAEARQRLVASWGPLDRMTTGTGAGEVWTQAVGLPDGGQWALDVIAGQPAGVSPISVSAWAERGRDGLDLPLAGLVAGTATWALGRSQACVTAEEASLSDGGATPAEPAWFRTAPAGWDGLPGQAAPGTLGAPWSLDEGWRAIFTGLAAGGEGTSGVGAGDGACVLRGPEGGQVGLPAGWGASATEPALVVVVGGASLDARGLGERWGVIVVDGGDVRLDGTRLHGGVFATCTVDFGAGGAVAFSRTVVRWATDRSLVRVRLVPGSRRETLE